MADTEVKRLFAARRAAEPAPLPTPELRLSPAGVLVKRDLCREPGWTDPHWTIVLVPAGDIRHHIGQHLVDQAVAGWSLLVRREVTR